MLSRPITWAGFPIGHPAHLQATERSDGLEDDQDTSRVAGQVAQLHIILGDHDLEGVIDPAAIPRF